MLDCGKQAGLANGKEDQESEFPPQQDELGRPECKDQPDQPGR